MADQERPEDDSQETRRKSQLPEGRRVVRKKKRRSSSNRETVILSKRRILEEMVDDEAERPMDVREQMDRLRSVKKEQKKNSDPPMEEKWGSRGHRRKGSRWLLWAIFLTVVPLLIFVVISSIGRSSGSRSEVRGGSSLNLDEEEVSENSFLASDPVTWFHENSIEAYEDSIAILDQINEGDNALATVSLMRDPERVKEKMVEMNFEWQSEFQIADPRTLSWDYDASGDIGYIVITGKKSSIEPFRAYFVKTNTGIRMDWEATTGWSEVKVGDLVANSPTLPVLVRGWLVKKPHFDSDSDALNSWYQILSPDKGEFVWIYTPSDSAFDEELKFELNYGRMVMERIEEKRMILRVRNGGPGRRENEFELVEFVGLDWVQP